MLDVMNGTVVRAVGGRRSEYRPVVSRLTDSTEPLTVAKALLAATGVSELYVADLDAILGEPEPQGSWVRSGGASFQLAVARCNLAPLGWLAPAALAGRVHQEITVWLDIGLRDASETIHLARFRNVRPVIASETFGGSASHDELLRLRPAVSIDLRNGELLSASSDITSPHELAERMHTAGYRTFLLLDLARVGMNAGPGTEPLCGELRRRYPDIELLVGGGVRNRDDMRRLEDAGADGVLVASALHDGTLP